MPAAAAMRRESNAPEHRRKKSPIGPRLARRGTGANTSEPVLIGNSNSGRERAPRARDCRHENSRHHDRDIGTGGLRKPPTWRSRAWAGRSWFSGRTACCSAERSGLCPVAATSWLQLRGCGSTGSPPRRVRYHRTSGDRHVADRRCGRGHPVTLCRQRQAQSHVCQRCRHGVSTKQRMNTHIGDGAPEEYAGHQSCRQPPPERSLAVHF